MAERIPTHLPYALKSTKLELDIESNNPADWDPATNVIGKNNDSCPPEPMLSARSLPSTATLDALQVLDRPRRPSPPPQGRRCREPDSPTLLARTFPSSATLNELSLLESISNSVEQLRGAPIQLERDLSSSSTARSHSQEKRPFTNVNGAAIDQDQDRPNK